MTDRDSTQTTPGLYLKAELDILNATWGDLRRYVAHCAYLDDREPLGVTIDAGYEIVGLEEYVAVGDD